MRLEQIKRGLAKCMKNPWHIFIYLNEMGLLNGLKDDIFLPLLYRASTSEKLNLKNPQTFNEKLQWLKLHDHRPEYSIMVDKIESKKYVEGKLGKHWIVPILAEWDSPSQIDFTSLPNQFVLKCNHNSGLGMYICKDKAQLDQEKVVRLLQEGIEQDYFSTTREWPYKNVRHRVFAETFLSDGEHGAGLIDYKFYCFNGDPKFFYLGYANITNGQKADLVSFFNMDFSPAPFYRTDHQPFPFQVEKPACFDEMVAAAQKLSEGIPFVRIDFFLVNQKPYFAECTFFPGGGYGLFHPREWERKIGDWLKL